MSLAPQRTQTWPDAAPRAVGDLRRITLSWHTDVQFDHYRVLGHRVGVPPQVPALLGVTRAGVFVHEHLQPAGERWRYTLIAVTADGRSVAATPVEAECRPSITRTGTALAVVGAFDDDARDLALHGSAYARYRSVFRDDVDVHVDRVPAGQGWSWVHPGPQDAWAGRREHRFRLRFHLDAPPRGDLSLALWLTDRHPVHPGTALLSLNGTCVTRLIFEPSPVARSEVGAVPGQGAGPTQIERRVCGSLFRPGENVLDIVKDTGSWITYDAVGIFA